MLYIENGTIYITRSDDAVVHVDVINGDSAYTMDAGDILTLTVREMPSEDAAVLLTINSAPGSNRIIFNSADTAPFSPGRYSADIQLTSIDGKVRTIWPELQGAMRYKIQNWMNFVVMPEVTMQ